MKWQNFLEAYNNDRPMSDNPYRPGSNEHMDWDAGWQYEDDKDVGEKHQ